MLKNSILISEMTPEQLEKLVGSCVKNQFVDFKKALGSISSFDELMSRDEACKFLKIDLSTLWHWTKKGKVKAYAIASRRYYKKSELIEALKPVNN